MSIAAILLEVFSFLLGTHDVADLPRNMVYITATFQSGIKYTAIQRIPDTTIQHMLDVPQT